MIIIKRFIQVALFTVFFLCSSAWSQIVDSGVIDEVRRDEGWMVINGTEYGFRTNQLKVVYQGENTRLVYVQEGIRVRFRTDREGFITQITLVGPQDRLNMIKNQ